MLESEDIRRSLHRRKTRSSGSSHRWSRVLALTDGKCFYCGDDLTPDTRTRDHVHPRKYGGKGKRYNLVAACRYCNGAKAAHSIDVYRRRTIGNEWFYGERMEIENMADSGAIDRELALALLDEGPLGADCD